MDKEWAFCGVSRNPNIGWDIVNKNPNTKWSYYYLCQNTMEIAKNKFIEINTENILKALESKKN